MCGIVGGVGRQPCLEALLSSLQCLEYRGYDSAGLAALDAEGQLHCIRCVGKVDQLIEAVHASGVAGCVGIAHTRWATHGKPSERNAHPHVSGDRIALVHNGVVENYAMLADQLVDKGYALHSDTDSECIAHLLHAQRQHLPMLDALCAVRQQLKGSYALAVIDQADPTRLWALSERSPLVIGLGCDGHYVASDQLALLGKASHFVYLQSGQMACLSAEGFEVFDAQGCVMQPEVHTLHLDLTQADLGGHRHYMHKEIFEQPHIMELLEANYGHEGALAAAWQPEWLGAVQRVQIVACGSSYYAGLLGQWFLEQWARLPTQVGIASEFRDVTPLVEAGTLLVVISQSGETADTLAALRLAKQYDYVATLAICNVAQSAMVRESTHALHTLAGPEIGVASSKAFSAQLVVLQWLAGALAGCRGLSVPMEGLQGLSPSLQGVLALESALERMAHALAVADKALFIGRNWAYPVALEGALKLKEISYIHAQAYPAGELKHGPLALVDRQLPVVACIPSGRVGEKTLHQCETVAAREGQLYLLVAAEVMLPASLQSAQVLRLPPMPAAHELLAMVVALQLLAYHAALGKGLDVDKPRNLAKSVTVE